MRAVTLELNVYQPDRGVPGTNPLLAIIPAQPEAALPGRPYHDFNERIEDECYAPLSHAEVFTAGKEALNLYAWCGFSLGPTLGIWLQRHAPDTLKAMVDGDRLSIQRLGYGNAIFQPFSHMILPLSTDEDKCTQIEWGKVYFKSVFGRDPKGVHLPEMAVDTKTLELLADAGIEFALLCQYQARSWRAGADSNWLNGVDPSRPYRFNLPSGRTIDLFFYDGSISKSVAFDEKYESSTVLSNAENLQARVMEGFASGRKHNELVVVACDGETFGHHHHFAEMCLAKVVDWFNSGSDVMVSNLAAFLAHNPPTAEVLIREPSAWSCSHGVGRWWRDCGCSTGGAIGEHQRWREPLRNSLDWLRGRLDQLFASVGSQLFRDPWAARNAYIRVVLDPNNSSGFIAEFGRANLSSDQIGEAYRLLEMERYRMLMYTSCGWFFHELAEIEPVQNLVCCAYAMQLAQGFTQEDLEGPFLSILEKAESNYPEYGNGRGVWDKKVRPALQSLSEEWIPAQDASAS